MNNPIEEFNTKVIVNQIKNIIPPENKKPKISHKEQYHIVTCKKLNCEICQDITERLEK